MKITIIATGFEKNKDDKFTTTLPMGAPEPSVNTVSANTIRAAAKEEVEDDDPWNRVIKNVSGPRNIRRK